MGPSRFSNASSRMNASTIENLYEEILPQYMPTLDEEEPDQGDAASVGVFLYFVRRALIDFQWCILHELFAFSLVPELTTELDDWSNLY